VVTVHAVVHIPVHIRVLEVVGVIAAMAARALELRIVSADNVASRALAVCVAMVDGELRVLRVIKSRPGPIARAHAVAGPARCGREENAIRRRGMRRVSGAVVIGLMARYARVAV